jgi:conjugal transfer/entry exclusion protein
VLQLREPARRVPVPLSLPSEEYEKLNKICETLYHENENLKNQLSEMDFSLKQKYESERQKNADLLAEIDKWKTRYQAAEKSKSKEL